MDKMKMQTPNFVNENIKKIAELFPNCITETISTVNGQRQTVNGIDFDQLRQELSASLVEGTQERYTLNWPGKNEAILTANAPIAKTLRPCKAESVDFENTRNVYIEGDNLDALKLLQETYLNKVKMIYIDPPYNTGNDFIYEDDFAEDTEAFLQRSNQKDEEGNRLVANTEANGRFHSDWLTMIYPRLKLARNLLRDDGVIFISIDDNEITNLRKVCDEVFGETNRYCTFSWKRRSGAMDSVNNVSSDHEYVVCYGKTQGKLNGVKRSYERYSNPDNDPRGPWIADNLSAGKPGGNTYYAVIDPENGNAYWPPKGRYWPYSPETMSSKIKEGRIIFPKSKDGSPLLKRFQLEAKSEVVPISTWGVDKTSKVSNAFITSLNTEGTKELKTLFSDKVFTFPKPTQLVISLLQQGTESKDIVLDFFSGSATTAHAVMQLNAEDNGNRQFIMVQLPEACDEKSEAYKAGYKTIAEIGKERIRRAGKKIKEENPLTTQNLDVGFRVFKVDTSNIKEVYYTPEELKQENLELFKDHIKPDRSPEDLLFQVFIDWGLDLTLPIAQKTIDGKTVFLVDANALVACFDAPVTEDLVKKLAAHKPLRVVFRDDAFSSDSVKINVEQIFKLLSPGTEVKSI
ncbi:MAG: site-specific DNA-methyltransferase [SAR324 cluster bacterium]|nr:site-specific DNA-methyltransferase [SAR324 cluster bacterium]